MVTPTILAIVVLFVLFWPRPGRDWRSSGAVLALGLWMAVRDPVGPVSRPAAAGAGISLPSNRDDTLVVPVVPGVATGTRPEDAVTEELPDITKILSPEKLQTDEVYITYDRDGRRSLVTTGEHDLTELRPGWYREVTQPHSVRDFQRYLARHGGAARYARLRDGFGPGDDAPVGTDRDWDDAWERYRRGAGAYSGRSGAGSHGARNYRRYSPGRSNVPQPAYARQDFGEQRRIRSHRHCPGCTGHDWTAHGQFIGLLRVAAAYGVGWSVVWLGQRAGLWIFAGMDIVLYTAMVSGVTFAAMLLKGALRGA